MDNKKINNDLKDVYNQISDEFSASRVYPWEELQVFIPYFKEGFKVLDLGCGNGRFIKSLNEVGLNYDYLGVDFSEGLISQAKKEFPDYIFEVADMRDLSFEPESFDMIVSIAAFHHLTSVKERKEMLDNMYAWLRPGGHLFMTNWNLLQKKYFKHILKNFWQKKAWNDFFIPWQKYLGDEKKHWRYYHSFTERELESLLKKANFQMQPKGVYKTKWNINCLVKK